jgi:two-component system chemotaxis response regulator CheB
MAASTGGPAVLQTILNQLPKDFPAPILIVQHIAHGFIQGVAEWLDKTSALEIRVASDGQELQPGVAYFAPDDLHLGLRSKSRLQLSDSPPIKGFRPSATYLFDSVAETFDGNAVGVVLTGMGEDGLDGLRKLAKANGHIIAQSKNSSVVFGMPGVAVRDGLADQILAPGSIAHALIEACQPQAFR